MTEKELQQMKETTRIENKLMLTSDLDIEKEVVAFLNYKEGGFVYIGVDKEGNTVGVEDVDDCMLRLKDRIKNNISPSVMGLFDISEERKEGCSVVKVTIASGIEKPYFKTKYGMTSRGAFIRVGTSAEPMPQEMIDRLFSMRTRNSIGKIVSNRQDLTFEQLRIYYDEHKKRLSDNFARSLELLTEDGKYNYVAYLLADQVSDQVRDQVSDQVSDQVVTSKQIRKNVLTNKQRDILNFCSVPRSAQEILGKLGLSNHSVNKKKYIQPLLNMGALEMTNPDKPNDRNQKYRKVRR